MEEEKQNPSVENQPRRSIQDIGLIRPPQKAEAPRGLEKALEETRKENAQSSIKAIKTYQSDVAEAIKKDNVSVIKMALAEKKRQERQGLTTENVTKESRKRLMYITGSAILIVAGISLAGYFYFSHKNGGLPVAVDISKNLIYSEKNTEIKLGNPSSKILAADMAVIKSNSRPNASIENLIITENRATSSTANVAAARKRIGGQELINLFSSNIPGPFLRSIQDSFMLGFYQNSAGPDTFLILKTDSYENAFAGMLEWERWINYDMSQLFSTPILNADINNVNASTTIPSLGVPKPFTDRVIENRDTRVLIDNSGQVVFLYSFIDSNTLVMTTSENSFREILSRFIQVERQK